MPARRHRCCVCRKLSTQTHRINGGPWHCFDGCHSTLGVDRRTYDGAPAWLPHNGKPPFDPSRMINPRK
jgi:hypothetical protein